MILYLDFTAWIHRHEFHWTRPQRSVYIYASSPQWLSGTVGSQYIWNSTIWMWHLVCKVSLDFPWTHLLPQRLLFFPTTEVQKWSFILIFLAPGMGVKESHNSVALSALPWTPSSATIQGQHSLLFLQPQAGFVPTQRWNTLRLSQFLCSSPCSRFLGSKKFKVSAFERVAQEQCQYRDPKHMVLAPIGSKKVSNSWFCGWQGVLLELCLELLKHHGKTLGSPSHVAACRRAYHSFCASLSSSKPVRWWCWSVSEEPFPRLSSSMFQQLWKLFGSLCSGTKLCWLSHVLLHFCQHAENPQKSGSAFLMHQGHLVSCTPHTCY